MLNPNAALGSSNSDPLLCLLRLMRYQEGNWPHDLSATQKYEPASRRHADKKTKLPGIHVFLL